MFNFARGGRLLMALAVGLLPFFLGGCRAQTLAQIVPLPQLPTGPVEMRVAYLVNDRLPKMTPEQLQVLLANARTTAKEHFGIEIAFTEPREVPIKQAFAAIPPANRNYALKQIFDFKSGKGDVARLGTAFGRAFGKSNEPLGEQIAFALPHAPSLRTQASHDEFGKAMAELQLRRLGDWRQMKALDGGSVIDDSELNEFMMWIALGYSDLPYELVLTNQVIASVEYILPAVHSAIRGGYTNGITTYSKSTRFGTMSVWSTFAFTGNDDSLVKWRSGERYEPVEAAELAGATATHELGHQLFHLLHPFARPACVMSPVPMFSYREWQRKLSPAECRIGSDAAMSPGAYKFHY